MLLLLSVIGRCHKCILPLRKFEEPKNKNCEFLVHKGLSGGQAAVAGRWWTAGDGRLATASAGATAGGALPEAEIDTYTLPEAEINTYTFPEAEIVRIHSFFWELLFEQHARPCEGTRGPTIDVFTRTKYYF